MGSLTLSLEEVRCLAEACGFTVQGDDSLDMETCVTVSDCPSGGLLDEDREVSTRYFYDHVVHFSDMPEEGFIGLGPSRMELPE